MMKKKFVDVYYDDELSPPCWMARSGYIESDGSVVVLDSDCARNKKEAEKIASSWKKKLKKVL